MPRRQIRNAQPETDEERAWRWTLWLTFAITVLRLIWLALDRTDLTPDEAQLWVWARNPAWGYPGQPPLTTWLVALTSGLFSDSTSSVRLVAPLLNFATALIVYRAAHLLYDARTASWAAIIFVTLPVVSFASAIVSSEAPLLFFWSVALYALFRARATGDRRWWLLIGSACGFGILAKYAMIEWVVCAFLYIVTVREARRQWSLLIGAAALGLAIASPNFIWNYAHGFPSAPAASALDAEALWEFFVLQFAVFGPLLLAALIAMVATAGRSLPDARAALLISFILPPIALMLGASLFSHADVESAAPAYIAATILVVAWLRAEGRQILISVSLGIHIAAAVLVGIGLRDAAALARIDVPMKYDPLQGSEGWRRLARAVTTILRDHPGAILMTDDRELLNELMFYVEPHPLNALEWQSNDLARILGAEVLLVARDPDNLPAILARFGEVGPPQSITIFLGRAGLASTPEEQRRYAVYSLKGFRGR